MERLKEIAVSYPGFEQQRLSVKPTSWFVGPRLLVNGVLAKRLRGLRYSIKNDSGIEVPIKFKVDFLNIFEPVPKLIIGKDTIEVVPFLKWYQYCWSAIPIILIFAGGGIGAAVGVYAAHCNGIIFRSDDMKEWQKYFVTALVSATAVFAYIVLVMIAKILINTFIGPNA